MNEVLDAGLMIVGMFLFAFIASICLIWLQYMMKKNVWLRKAINNLTNINECVLDYEKRIEIANEINHQVIEFMNDWTEGDSNIFTIDLFDINLGGYDEGVDAEMTIIEERLGIEIESWTLTDDEELALEINTHALQNVYEQKMVNWCRENKLESEEYWSNRGVN